MTSPEMIGVVVISLGSILSLFVALTKMIISPLTDLNVTIAKLDSRLDHLGTDTQRLTLRVEAIEKKLEKRPS